MDWANRPELKGLRRVRARVSDSTLFYGALAVGGLSALGSLLIYDWRGYSGWMLLLWLVGLVGLSVAMASRNRAVPRIALADLLAPVGLALAFAPIYLLALYRWPVQVSSDEAAIGDAARQHADPDGIDPFGVGHYLGRPALGFIGWGNITQLFGGNFELHELRLQHAAFGLLTIAASYALFRQLLPRGWALFAAGLLGVSHAFLMISRLAMRENTSVLVEVVALALLLWGLRNDHFLATFLGGIVAGLGFYVYQPARITFPIWLVFLLLVGLVFRERFRLRRLIPLAAVAGAGFALMATPILIAESKAPSFLGQDSQVETLLIYPEARVVQMGWVHASSISEGYETNIRQGLSAFNNEVIDHGFIYVNEGHGFADPLTGILLWVGFGVVAISLIRRRADEGALLMLGGFVVLWLTYAFLVNKAPNYTRLLVTLPFVAFLVTMAVRWLASRWRSIRFAPAVLVVVSAVSLAAWNLSIAWDYVQEGRTLGDPIGSTGRYADSLAKRSVESLYIASSSGAPYHVWGDDFATMHRIKLFKADAQVAVIDPSSLAGFRAPAPFALFMRREAWMPAAADLAQAYPQGRIRNVMPDGSRVVLEVP
jgi:Dolichyl-phosphate-mannose-protein mannosyltransferase